MRILRDAQTTHTPTHTDPRLTPALDSLACGIRSHSPRQPLPMLCGLQVHGRAAWLAGIPGHPSSEQP